MDNAGEAIKKMRELRARNKGRYAFAEYLTGEDKTLNLLTKMFELYPELAKEWYREIWEDDRKISEIGEKLCE